jgi:multidrug transporter EmrE-like cation transporter
MIGYLWLLGVLVFETIAVISMDLSKWFADTKWTTIAVVTYAVTFVCLTIALKTIPAGIANAIWAGGSTILVALVARLFLHESLSAMQVVWLFVIAAGLVGLNLS